VTREILQQNKLVDVIRSNAVKKVLGMLTDLVTKDKDKYATFWKTFGRVLKEGLAEDYSNQETIAKLLRFASTHSASETQDVSLEDYVARMKEGQDKIYYITAESYSAAKDSPLLEIFKKKGVEVLLLSDPVDYLIGTEFREFKGFSFQSVSKGTIDLSKVKDEQGVEPQEEQQEPVGNIRDLLERLRKTLGEQVKEVRVTTRLTTSPACLVVGEYDIDPVFQRLLKATGQPLPDSKPILEINPQHPIIRKIQDEKDEKRFTDWAYVLFDQSVLGLGEQLENPTRFVNRLNDLLAQL
jgi:molecular chaperone HtpG